MLNNHFFQQYRLEIEKNKTEMQTLKQGDSIQSKDNEAGTLGGVVTKTNNNQKTYAVNSNHLFPRENEHVYTWDLDEIGAYVYIIDKECKGLGTISFIFSPVLMLLLKILQEIEM